jgi:5'-nucleotidase
MKAAGQSACPKAFPTPNGERASQAASLSMVPRSAKPLRSEQDVSILSYANGQWSQAYAAAEWEARVLILLTNDDGIYAPGLRALRPELQKIGQVIVVAPASEQSAVGHSVTIKNPLIVQEILDEKRERLGWAVEGRPADCVKLAIRELLPSTPDLVVSGLNAGGNAGINVLYSGTVAAAIEGAFFHCTSIACSLVFTEGKGAPQPDYPRGAEHARQIIEQILAQRPPTGMLFNVNIPDLDTPALRGVRTVPQNISSFEEAYDRRTDPRGRVYFWSHPEYSCPEPQPDTDITALAEGYITVTPLQFNLTHAEMLREMMTWTWRS